MRVVWLVEMLPEGTKLRFATADDAVLAAVDAMRERCAAGRGWSAADMERTEMSGPWVELLDERSGEAGL